jgi:superfamily II DNA or RNA helicase
MKRQINLRSNLKFRQYQSDSIQMAKRLINESPEAWHLFYAPTGTGKSLFEIGLLNELDTGMLITPRIEIIRDMLDKGGVYTDGVNEVVTTGQHFGIQTPVRLRNILGNGKLRYRPDVLIVDEAHHDLAETYQQIIMYLNYCTKIGATATAYRGTPKRLKRILFRFRFLRYGH